MRMREVQQHIPRHQVFALCRDPVHAKDSSNQRRGRRIQSRRVLSIVRETIGEDGTVVNSDKRSLPAVTETLHGYEGATEDVP